MSRKDLDQIQAHLKVAIQSHQLLVAKMKYDPQNGDLQRQLHDLQGQITNLSEKQKNIVQQLRKELVSKQAITMASELGQVKQHQHHHHHHQQLHRQPAANITQSPRKTAHNVLTSVNNNVTKPAGGRGRPGSRPGSRSGSPLIRVPHFTTNKPSLLQGGVKGGATMRLPTCTSPSTTTTHNRKTSDSDFNSYIKRSSLERKELSPEQRKKLEYMATLDLITPDTLKELQSRRSERKRRSTANPQFSYGHFEPTENDVHEDFCAECHRSGELLMCDTCSLVYHLNCLEPPVTAIPQGLWSCPKCKALGSGDNNNWPGTLALVHSYITHKAAKEDDKRRLQRKVQELKSEQSELENRAKTLSETIKNQIQQKAEMLNSNHSAQHSVDQLKSLISMFTQSS